MSALKRNDSGVDASFKLRRRVHKFMQRERNVSLYIIHGERHPASQEEKGRRGGRPSAFGKLARQASL